MKKEESLKKLSFYDNWFKSLSISFILFFLGIFFIEVETGILFWIWILSIFAFMISLGVITWGMIYHMVKGKYWVWLILTIVFIFITGGFLIAIIFYFVKMRGNFKKGKGVYGDGLYTNIFSKESFGKKPKKSKKNRKS